MLHQPHFQGLSLYPPLPAGHCLREKPSGRGWCYICFVVVVVFFLFVIFVFVFLSHPQGIQDNSTGEYIITHPTWSKVVHYNGTRIAYIHEDNKYDDKIKINGPTTLPLRVVVSYF